MKAILIINNIHFQNEKNIQNDRPVFGLKKIKPNGKKKKPQNDFNN